MSQKERYGALIALLIGVIAGVFFGMFYDPDSLKEARDKMRKKGSEIKDKALENLQNVNLGD